MPRPLLRLREPAPLHRLHAVEAALGAALPRLYRSFLLVGDGGFLGDCRVYGTSELLAILRQRQVVAGIGREARTGLLPFHPVDRFGIECFDLDQAGAPVVWCRTRLPDDEAVFVAVHPLAWRVRCGATVGVAADTTYVDFLDWALDVLQGMSAPALAMPGPGRG